MRRQAARSSASMARASCKQGLAHGVSAAGDGLGEAPRMRSMAQKRLTAVGRVARRSSQIASNAAASEVSRRFASTRQGPPRTPPRRRWPARRGRPCADRLRYFRHAGAADPGLLARQLRWSRMTTAPSGSQRTGAITSVGLLVMVAGYNRRLRAPHEQRARTFGFRSAARRARPDESSGRRAIGLDDSLGRVLAQAVASDVDMPPFDRSAMDGFALRSADVRRCRQRCGSWDRSGPASRRPFPSAPAKPCRS